MRGRSKVPDALPKRTATGARPRDLPLFLPGPGAAQSEVAQRGVERGGGCRDPPALGPMQAGLFAKNRFFREKKRTDFARFWARVRSVSTRRPCNLLKSNRLAGGLECSPESHLTINRADGT